MYVAKNALRSIKPDADPSRGIYGVWNWSAAFPFVIAGLLFSGCATESGLDDVSEDHPAHPDAQSGAFTLPPNPLGVDLEGPVGKAGEKDTPHQDHGDAKASTPDTQHGEGQSVGAKLPAAIQAEIDRLVSAYLSLVELLARDELEGTAAALVDIRTSADRISAGSQEAPLKALADAIKASTPENATSLKQLRSDLKMLSNAVISLAETAPPTSAVSPVLRKAYCPMVKAPWLQRVPEVANPYYGGEMLRCGSVTETIRPHEPNEHGEHETR